MEKENNNWTTLEYNGKQVRKFCSKAATAQQQDDFICYYAIDVATILGIKNISMSTKNFTDEQYVTNHHRSQYSIKTHKTHRSKTVEDNKILLLTPLGVNRLIQSSRHPDSLKIAQFFGINIHENKFCAKETSAINAIIKAVNGIAECSIQHVVPSYNDTNYRIDLYLPEFNIAIECDEFDHANRDPKYEQQREQEIKNKLSLPNLPCEFIRFNPDSPDFDVYTLINKVFKKILS